MLHGNRRLVGWIAWTVLTIAIVGCGSSGPRQTRRMQELGIEDLSAQELRIQVSAFAVRFAGVVEVAADEIASRTDDPEILRNAAIWKVYSVPAILRVTSLSEPVGAYVTTWAACLLMLEYFEIGIGAELFGEHQQIAIEACRQLVREIDAIGAGIPVDEEVRSEGRANMAAWVEANPLSNHLYTSHAPTDHLVDLTKGYDSGLVSIAEDVQDQIVELNDRLSIQTTLLPRQVRWQAELAVLEMTDPESVDRILQATYRGSKGIIASERDSVVSAVGAEREALMRSVDEQRVATLEWMTGERMAVLNAMREERIAALEQMEEMSLRMLDASFEHLGATEARMLLAVQDQMDRTIDRTFAKITMLLIGTGIAIALVLVLGMWVYVTRIRGVTR
jgi:hypothetical protein